MDAATLSREVLSLLDVRESARMPVWAVQHLREVLGAQQASVLQVFPAGAARRKDAPDAKFAVASDADPVPQAVPARSELARTLEERRPVQGAGELLVPLVAFNEVRYVVRIAGARAADVDCLLPLLACYFERVVDAETDPLTRLSNRRVFYSRVSAGMYRWVKGAYRHFMAVADIDHFKQVNDRYGHLYGDEILIHFARLMRRTFRAGDLLFRFGGEEFVAVFGVEDEEMKPTPLERFRQATEEYAFPKVGRVTVSLGVVAIGDGSFPATTLFDRADQALYYAKSHGRNRVCDYDELVAAGEIAPPQKPAASEAELF
jgi:diguanylate cyclase (GGDEF)-like protein